MSRILLDSPQYFHTRSEWFQDESLKERIARCIAAQRKAATIARKRFQSNIHAEEKVSHETLEQILASGKDIHGISSSSDISNVISFNAEHLSGAVNDDRVANLRKQVDEILIERLKDTFEYKGVLSFVCSGHFWYPPGGYMGWHTNSGAPGWRVYLTHASESNKSFFRYRDPENGNIVTSSDENWDVRLFRVEPGNPIWHSVYSQTDRFSLGYAVFPRRPIRALAGRLKSVLKSGISFK